MADPALKEKHQITVAWWNTSLAPRALTRASEGLRTAAASVIKLLLINNRVSFLALGEMSLEDMNHLEQLISIKNMKFESGITSAGRAKYDTCYIYDTEIFELIRIEDISSSDGGSTLKVAQQLTLIEKLSGKPIFILASHWPSRLNVGEHDPVRDELGIRLRDTTRNITTPDGSQPNIILLGDYNEEPFSRALSVQLKASRHREFVSRKEHLIYNPFWGFLGQRNTDLKRPLGSHYWKGGTVSKWFTFDQIMFSSSLTRGDDWSLLENGEHFANIADLTALVIDSKSEFDHIPVYATIEKEVA
ncbi:hypothetical protein ABH912_006105 [Pseudomonas sp. BT76 TE3572]|uniref:endonuclease/exonuclease/phosphatase family protein n=1 Tax=Pseudomonas sp. BT76 TE3572 TaxID=3349325 RepID=UPI003D24EA6B